MSRIVNNLMVMILLIIVKSGEGRHTSGAEMNFIKKREKILESAE